MRSFARDRGGEKPSKPFGFLKLATLAPRSLTASRAPLLPEHRTSHLRCSCSRPGGRSHSAHRTPRQPHSEDQRSSRVRFRSHSETIRVSRTPVRRTVVPPMAINDACPEGCDGRDVRSMSTLRCEGRRSSSIVRCAGHHGPRHEDTPEEKGRPWTEPGPAPASSGEERVIRLNPHI